MDPKIFGFVYAFFYIVCSMFLLFLLRPLYKLAHQRTALYILLSKMTTTLCNQISTIFYRIWIEFLYPDSENEENESEEILPVYVYIYVCLSTVIYSTIFLHVALLAINRFVAIFFPTHYKRIWTGKNIAIYIAICWTVGSCIGVFNVLKLCFKWELKLEIQSIVLAISGLIYLAIAFKFLKAYVSSKMNLVATTTTNGTMHKQHKSEKDRALIFAICLLSLLPIPLQGALGLLRAQYPQLSIGWDIVSIAHIANETAVQCVEECCLLVFCKDFRLLVKQQFHCLFLCGFCGCCRAKLEKNTTTTNVISTAAKSIKIIRV